MLTEESVVAVNNAREKFRQAKLLYFIDTRRIPARIARKIRRKALKSNNWRVEVRFSWFARYAFETTADTMFAKDYIQAELQKLEMTIPIDIGVVIPTRSLVRDPWSPFVTIHPVSIR